MTGSSHEAAASALGYLYQAQWPLVDLVVRSRNDPDCEVALELLDDVSWGPDGSPTELIQSKHHLNAGGDLGDKSVDMWRTIASWMDAHPPGDVGGPILSLVSTTIAPAGSAACALRPPEPDWHTALTLLENAANTSTSQQTQSARDRFLALEPTARSILVSRMQVLDGAATIEELPTLLRRELHLVLPIEHEDTFVDLLWAWWHQCVVHLLRRTKRSISALELRAFIDDLRDKFTADNLPTLVSRWDADSLAIDDYADRVFVQQLGWVDVPSLVLTSAIQNYFRAVTQSARWIEENLVGFAEVERFEAELKDEWARIFAWVEQRLPDDADDAMKVEAGRQVLQQAEDLLTIRIRERYSEPFYFRGKLQELADERVIGWHPDFSLRLDALLLKAGS